MKKLALLTLLAISIEAYAQKDIAVLNRLSVAPVETGGAVISGIITTTDNHPASFVTISVKGMNRFTTSDENGFFSLRNLKEGTYVLEISMIGLHPQEKTIEVKKDGVMNISISLSEDVKKLAEIIIITGRRLNSRTVEIGKININPMDLPQALTVIGQGFIREQQALRLSDIIKNVNGVYLTTTRGNVQESFAARGYSFGSTNMFKNGARINSGSMPEMSSLEKVEVLKGSSAILFGQVAPGGIVNMVTKQPKFKFGGEISFRTGSFDLYKPAFDIYGPATKNIAYRVNGTFERANSFRNNISSQRYYVNPSLLFKLGSNTELVIEADYLNHEFTPDFGIGSLGNTKIPDVPRNRFMGTSWQYNTTQQSTATATVKHDFNVDWKLNSSLSYQYYTRDYYGVERIQAAANGDWTRPLGKILTYENYYTGQINLIGKFMTGKISHDLLTGIDADRTITLNNDFSFPAVVGLPAGGYDKINILDPSKYVQRTDMPIATNVRKREIPVNRFGAYVQDLIKITPKLNVLAGIRWSHVAAIGIDSINVLTGVKTKGKDKFDKAFSPRFGIVYKPYNTTSLFASYSNSFVVNTGQDVNGNQLDPSIIDQYEIGIKNEFWNGLLSANITVYRIRNSNLAQTAPFLSDGVTPNNNTSIKALMGQTLSDGVEVDLSSHPLKGLEITAGYSYNYARYMKAPVSTGSNKAGERLVNNPNHTANTTVFYTFHNKGWKGLKVGASVFYIGDRFGGWNNTVNQSQNYSRLIFVNGYTTIDVSAGYTYKKMSLLAKVSNLTNTLNYSVHENYSVNPISPTQFIATISYKF